jgi:hypothetical protein
MHPIAVIRPVVVILAGAVAAGFVTGIAARSGSAGVAEVIWVLWGVLAVWQGWKVATWWRRYFVVTENRLMLITSLVDTDVGMMPLAKVTDMRLHQSTFGQALGYADFIVESAGQDQALSRINFVPYPSQMYQEILALIFSPRRSGGNGGDLRLHRLPGIAGLPAGVVPATARARRVTGDELSSLLVMAACVSRGRGACGAGPPFWGAAGYLRPGRRYALGRAPSTQSDHMAVYCNAPGCRSAWYQPRHEPGARA